MEEDIEEGTLENFVHEKVIDRFARSQICVSKAARKLFLSFLNQRKEKK